MVKIAIRKQITLFLSIETMKLISISYVKKSFEIMISKCYRGARPHFPSNADSVLGPLPHPPKKGSKENFRLGAYWRWWIELENWEKNGKFFFATAASFEARNLASEIWFQRKHWIVQSRKNSEITGKCL